jgi:hypothetical protein
MTKYQLLPPLSEEEYASLFDDIAAGGVKVPIDVDEQGEILDGHHRKRICDELGIECPTRVVELPESAKADYALTVNLARRHLDRMQRRQLVANSLKLDYRLGDRVHARRCGVDHKTVTSVRGDLVAVGEIPHLPEREGADGKTYPASKPPAKVAPEPPAPATPAETSGPASPSPAGGSGVNHPAPPLGDAADTSSHGADDLGDETADGELGSLSLSAVDEPERAVDAGVLSPSAPDLVNTPVGPMTREFAEQLDRLVPDPNPHREWQSAFLADVFAAAKLMRKYTGAEIAAKADQQLRVEFANFVADMDDKQRDVSKAQMAAGNTNVRQLRSVQ